jgi:CheY-like chemotaxis protein
MCGEGVSVSGVALAAPAVSMTTLLHVEDDLALAEMVHLTFEVFGFRGESLHAPSVREAAEIISDTRRYPEIDLVVSDMSLPDGTGLDVVRYVRSDPARNTTPILILAGNIDRTLVDRAYALGANSYIAKIGGPRPLPESLRALYDHWLSDALLPDPGDITPTKRIVARSVSLRARAADVFARFSKTFDEDATQSSFWMTHALRQGNMANLLHFLEMQLAEREPDPTYIDRLIVLQNRDELTLARVERELDERPERASQLALRGIIEHLRAFDAETFVKATGQLFPVSRAAVIALRKLVARNINDLVAWFESQPGLANDEDMTELRALTVDLRELLEDESEAAAAAPS